MSFLKRLLSGVIVIIFVLTSIAYASSFTDVTDTKFEKEIEVISSLGIMQGNEENNFAVNDAVTRAEFSAIISRFLGVEQLYENGGSIFKDVPDDYWASAYIKRASVLGLMRGLGEGTFAPDSPIMYEHAVKVIVSLLGYDLYARSKGGFPLGYLIVAGEKNITKGMELSSNEQISRGVLAYLLYNALDVEMMVQTTYGTDASYSIIKGKTILTENLHIYKKNGQVIANEDTGLAGPSILKKNEVLIGNDVLTIERVQAKHLLGYNTTYYYRWDNHLNIKTLVAVEVLKKNNDELYVDTENIENYENYELKYLTNKEKQRKTFSAIIDKGVSVIYNGMAVSTYGNLFRPEKGSLTLLDTDGNGCYDVVFVRDIREIVVSAINTTSYLVYDQFDVDNTVILDEGDNSIKISIYDIAGNRMNFSDLKEWDVLSIEESLSNSAKKLVNVTVSRITVTGTVSDIKSISEDEKLIIINDQEYIVGKRFIHSGGIQIKVGDEFEFCLDNAGKVVAVKNSINGGMKFGYLLLAYIPENGVDQTIQLKVLTEEGEIYIFKCSDKVTVNGERKKGQNIIDSVVNVKQLLRYETDYNNRIVLLDTAEEYQSENNIYISYPTTTATFRSSTSTFGGKVPIDGKTKIFVVPTAVDAVEDAYVVRKLNYLTNNQEYQIKAYNTVKRSETAEAIVILGNVNAISDNTPVTLVSKISDVIDESGNTVQKLYGLRGGKEIEIITKESNMLDSVLDHTGRRDKDGRTLTYKVEEGDTIRLGINSETKIAVVQMVYDRSQNLLVPSTSADFTHSIRFVLGYVYDKIGNRIKVSNAPITDHNISETDLESHLADKYNIYVYDAVANKKVSIGRTQDILGYMQAGDSCTKALIQTRSGDPSTIVIYK